MLFNLKKYKLKEKSRLNKIYEDLKLEKEIAKKNKILSLKISKLEKISQEKLTKIKVELISLNFTYQEICNL